MSEGAFWRRYPIVILAGIIGFALVAIVPAWLLGNYCSAENLNEGPASYHVTVDSTERQSGTPDAVNQPITQFSLGARFPGPITTTGRSEATYYTPPEIGNWWRKFACDITGADYTLALFTVILALSTIGLWWQTERLAKGADDQSQKMVRAINATLSVSSSTREVAGAMGDAASAMEKVAGISEAAMLATERSNQRQLRAYLSVEAAGVNQLIKSDQGMGHVIVRNVGKIPAHNVSVRVHMLISGDRWLALGPYDLDNETVSRAIHPDATMPQGSIETQAVAAICNPGTNVYVWGIVYYDDGYGKRRMTKFCHRYSTASFNRRGDWDREPSETRSIIDRDKARYHTEGNDAN